jgi:hypothetical protein
MKKKVKEVLNFHRHLKGVLPSQQKLVLHQYLKVIRVKVHCNQKVLKLIKLKQLNMEHFTRVI